MYRIESIRKVGTWLPFCLVATLVFVAACARPAAPLPEAPRAEPTPAPTLRLPADAGPHDALTEWWYYTGHLQSADGRPYGFEFTIFQVRRQGAPTGYLAHFAISDIDGTRFSHQSRFRQGEAFGVFPLDVDGWTLGTSSGADVIDAAMDAEPGAEVPFALRLSLTDEKQAALHHGGYIEYGPAGGSYYYSRTRIAASGSLSSAGGDPTAVSGVAWMDHQWGNFVVASGGGWDWYSLQLDDRTELMLYVLRGVDGQTTGVYGTQVLSDGGLVDLGPGTVSAEARGTWTSPHTGASYPSGWRLRLPSGERLELTPQLVDQELYFPDGSQKSEVRSQTSVGNGSSPGQPMAYWEGAVTASGDRTGVGYVELTGYASQ
jgi:predicted secreted hydrolase